MTEQITASAIISFCERLQDESARFYDELATRFPDHRPAFQGYARRCERNKTQIVRTYQETVTDALETGYSFDGLDLKEHTVDLTLPEGVDLVEALDTALELEEMAIAFYEEVAERSESLLATIPRAFQRVAKRRRQRQAELEELRLDVSSL